MKTAVLALLLALGSSLTFASAQAQAAQLSIGIGAGFGQAGVSLQIGAGAYSQQRYMPVGKVWVNEPYIYWQSIPDPLTGRIVRVQRIAYSRRLTVLYLDRWQGGYGYFDRFGNPIPWNNRWPW